MPHPHGGSGPTIELKHPFSKAYGFVGTESVTFPSTTGETIEQHADWRGIALHGPSSSMAALGMGAPVTLAGAFGVTATSHGLDSSLKR